MQKEVRALRCRNELLNVLTSMSSSALVSSLPSETSPSNKLDKSRYQTRKDYADMIAQLMEPDERRYQANSVSLLSETSRSSTRHYQYRYPASPCVATKQVDSDAQLSQGH